MRIQLYQSREFIATTGASSVAIGEYSHKLAAVGKKMVHTFSRDLTEAKRNCLTTDKELLGLSSF